MRVARQRCWLWSFTEDDRKGVTVLRLTSIDKLTDLELYLPAPRVVRLQNNRHSLQQILSLHYTHYQAQTSTWTLFKAFDTCT